MPLQLAPESVIEETAHWTLALNRNQNLLGKVMLVARRPVESVVAIETEEWLGLQHEIRRACTAIDALFRPDQYNHAFLMNLDPDVHLHIVPRYPRRTVMERRGLLRPPLRQLVRN